jgi:hypothetical protein
LGGCILVQARVVCLERCKHRIRIAHVECYQGGNEDAVLVRLERRGYGEFNLRIAIEHGDELALLDCGNETGSALGINSQVLTRYNTAHARPAKRLQVKTREAVLSRKKLDDKSVARRM